MTDRHTSIPGNQIEDNSLKQNEFDTTSTPTDGQFLRVNMPVGDFTPVNLENVTEIATIQTNIVLNAFRIAVNGSLTQFNMVDGIVDEYEDESAIDTLNSVDQVYDPTNDLYTPFGSPNLKLLLNLNGTDTATSTTDESDSAHTITFNDNAQLDTAQKKFGTASLLLDGTGDYLSIADSSDWDILNSEDLTIDLFVRHTDFTGLENYIGQFIDESNSWELLASTGNVQFQFTIGGVAQGSMTSTGTISDSNWHHIAVIKSGDNWGLYLDGTQVGYRNQSITDSSFASPLRIGSRDGSVRFFDGHMDSIRILKSNTFNASPNVGKTDTITVPTVEPVKSSGDMTLISDTFVAESTPSNARIVLFEEDIDSITLNTDLKAYTTRDSGQTFTTDFATDNKLDITGHGFSNTDRIMLTSSAQDLPGGLSSAIVYYVVNASTNDFELSLTSGGSAVAITTNGTGTHTAKQVNEITLSNDGEYETGKNILTGSIDISGQPSGTSMEYTIITLNGKNLNIHGIGLAWD